MIYTSYFSNIRSFPENIKPVSIALWPPKWFNGRRIMNLAPSKELLTWYKNAVNVPQEEKENHYTEVYGKFLRDNRVTADWFRRGIVTYFPSTLDGRPIYESQTDHVALCCYEKPGDFCHRHILSAYLTKDGLPIKELV